MMNSSCIECGALLKGRSDKKFCSDYCRATYHNTLYRKAASEQAPVTRILRRNFDILGKLHATGRRRADRASLKKLQFNTDYFTAARKGPFGRRIYSCYTYSYRFTLSGALRLLAV